MKLIVALVIFGLLSCKDAQLKEIKSMEEESELETGGAIREFPEALSKIFEAHGGLGAWKKKRTLSFTIPKPEMAETHNIDLYSRNERIEMPEMAMGFDGKNFWLADRKEIYKGDPIFYHNLMFYFYSMPFVLADKGVLYSRTEDLEYDGKVYPGIRISFSEGVGVSSKDEYYLHYDAETNQMVWLGYTVTYRSGEKSDNIKWIRYDDWMQVDDLVLPESISWYNYDGRNIKDVRNTVVFENVALSETPKPDSFFGIPENAKVITKPE